MRYQTQEEYADALRTLDRLEAEFGGELPELASGANTSPADRAQRLLDCGGPMEDEDAHFCRRLVAG